MISVAKEDYPCILLGQSEMCNHAKIAISRDYANSIVDHWSFVRLSIFVQQQNEIVTLNSRQRNENIHYVASSTKLRHHKWHVKNQSNQLMVKHENGGYWLQPKLEPEQWPSWGQRRCRQVPVIDCRGGGEECNQCNMTLLNLNHK